MAFFQIRHLINSGLSRPSSGMRRGDGTQLPPSVQRREGASLKIFTAQGLLEIQEGISKNLNELLNAKKVNKIREMEFKEFGWNQMPNREYRINWEVCTVN